MFTTLKIQFKLILERFINSFAQPRHGVVAPVDEKVKAVMEAPYKLEPLVTIEPKLTVAKKKAPAKPVAKKTTKKPVAKKAPAKKKAQ
jgi:hypothetical protein